ncbi:hypothetical protein ATN88_12470 [Enterovibrio coralii]|uniref:Uncharacterized protein n=2 Tax=Enterovibrio coralii TaxID=294935 RepID=A0A135I2Q0_9GAMM|nr:hypothetical protein ATN88_12470 [Enterovibrio coralii]
MGGVFVKNSAEFCADFGGVAGFTDGGSTPLLQVSLLLLINKKQNQSVNNLPNFLIKPHNSLIVLLTKASDVYG